MDITKRISGILWFLYYRFRGAAISTVLWAAPVFFLWNWLMPALFGLRPVTPEEALGLSAALAVIRQ